MLLDWNGVWWLQRKSVTKASSYCGAIAGREGDEQLIVQLNQKGDDLSLMIEGVIAVYNWNEGEVVPLQCSWPILVECWGEKPMMFSLYRIWTDSASTGDCADIPFPLLKFGTCSSRSSLAASHFDALDFLLTNGLSPTPFFIFHIFSVPYSRPRVREPTFHPSACMINVWTCNLYDELAFQEVTIWS